MNLSGNVLFLAMLWIALPALATASEYKFGDFEFDLPGSWQVRATGTGLTATQGDGKSIQSSLLKVEFCTSTEKTPCKAVVFFPPEGANPKNYFCGETKPVATKHPNGLDELRKMCSVTNVKGETQIGMLYLTHGQHSLGVALFVGQAGPAPSEFLDAFLSSLVLQ